MKIIYVSPLATEIIRQRNVKLTLDAAPVTKPGVSGAGDDVLASKIGRGADTLSAQETFRIYMQQENREFSSLSEANEAEYTQLRLLNAALREFYGQ